MGFLVAARRATDWGRDKIQSRELVRDQGKTMDMLPITTTAQNVRSGIAAALKDTPYTAYSVSLFPSKQRGQISLTVPGDQGRERTLTYLLGDRTYDDVAALHPGPNHDVHVISDVVDAHHIAAHVRAWLASA